MKAIVFLALVAFSQAAHLFYYAGTTNSTTGGTSPTANYATITGGVCTASTTASGYQKFTINSTANPTSTFYWITALFEKQTFSTAQLQVYNGAYTPATPCTNILFVGGTTTNAPHISILTYLPPGLHDVVITTTSPTDAGVFAVHADRAAWTAGTTDASPYMLEQSTGLSSCSSYSVGAPYTYYQWTATTTGKIDIVAFSYNSTVADSDFVAVVYNTSSLAFLGTGNATNPADGCVAGWVAANGEDTTYTKISQNNYAASIFIGFQQTAGTNYTIVLVGYNSDDTNQYGVFIRPTVQGYLGTVASFYRPDFGTLQDGDVCENGTTAYNWKPVVFTAQYTTYVVDTGASDFDTAACLYYGNNEGSADQTVGPIPCGANWLACGDTGDRGPLHQLGTTPGRNYTVVQTSYATGNAGEEFTLWVYTGVQLGPLPVTTTGVETGLLSSSSASAIVASLALIFAAFFF